ncbi:hypothetical protein H17ap60334_04937 [Thermosipho africanus H17ap60334]|uniref:hypothetical protein n=1 Tax=Thermosipho africanus TaxID=2421 RepID=UPI00028CF026|nr:hypothetical protein [Thermosipho africanus]EKF49529.1 hypothetical protein H17ap60334_04937 [Thermosipho africanus H17ap60334]
MTNLEYLRMRIPDKDTLNPIFSDNELQEIIQLNTEIKVFEAEQVDVEGTIYKIPAQRLDEDYQERVFLDFLDVSNEITSGFTVNKQVGWIIFDEGITDRNIYVQAKVINWDNVLAECYESIMGDINKLNSYSIQNASQQMDDTKAHLRYLVNYYRSPRGWDL